MRRFINVSNHPSKGWGERQMQAAEVFGQVVDVAFPNVPPTASLGDVESLADKCAEQIKALCPVAAMVSGEATLAAAVVRRLQTARIVCYVATTERVVTETKLPDGSVDKAARFEFVAWRAWPKLTPDNHKAELS